MSSQIPISLALLVLAGCAPAAGTDSAVAPASFDAVLSNVLVPSCAGAGCHSATTGAGGLFLEGDRAYDSLLNEPCSNEVAIAEGLLRVTPYDPTRSYLYLKLTDPQGMGDWMPPVGALDSADIDLVERWILEGASP